MPTRQGRKSLGKANWPTRRCLKESLGSRRAFSLGRDIKNAGGWLDLNSETCKGVH